LSGYALEDAGWRGAPGQVRGYLQKPVSLEDLSGAVRRLLDQPTSPLGDFDAPPDPVGAEAHPPGLQPADRRPFIATGPTEAAISMAEVRLRHLGYDPIERLPLGDLPIWTGDLPAFVMAVLEPPYDEAMEILCRHRAGGRESARPPLLVLAPTLSTEVESRFHELFPAGFRTLSTGLGELGIQVQHLRRVGALHLGLDEERASLEARVHARGAELESAHRDVLLRLARAAEFRDDLTGRHAERVGYFAALLGRELGLDEDQVAILGQAAPLHDVGKIAIPDAILNKPGRLTATERSLMERHCEIGGSLLRGSRHPLIQEAEIIARNHHEWWDGSGYPKRLVGPNIPRSARIVAVADVFDTITHLRPYRVASTLDGALSIIKDGRGTHFEPDVAHALDDLARRGVVVSDPDEALVAAPDSTPMSPLEIRQMLADLG
ncbi:MAG TPA: HD domain-containing phosphohydrolase, partial [Longimicrobiales bacterium]